MCCSLFTLRVAKSTSPASLSTRTSSGWPIARNATMDESGFLENCRYLLHDRDTKYSAALRAIIESGRVKTLVLPRRSPNLNAHAERWVRSAKDECLSKMILFGGRSLRRAMKEYVEHYHTERNHQGKGNVLVFQWVTEASRQSAAVSRAARWALALLASNAA